MEMTYDWLYRIMKETGRPYDYEEVHKAYDFAFEAHKGQKRQSGEPYFLHPLNVAAILVNLGMDTDCIIAAFSTMWWRTPGAP